MAVDSMSLIRSLAYILLAVGITTAPVPSKGAPILKEGTDILPREADGKVLGKRAGNRIYSGDIVYYLPEVGLEAVRPNRWPNGVLVFEFATGLDSVKRQAFRDACNAWTTSTPLRCQERTNQQWYVRIEEHSGEGCGGFHNVSCAPLGFQPMVRSVEIYVTHWASPYILQHEIGHVIGFIHEHQREDRDAFVQIKFANVREGAAPQFETIPAEFLLDYDYVSIMHYGNCTFSRFSPCSSFDPADESKWTIVPRPCGVPDQVGGLTITALDLDSVRQAYAPRIVGLYSSSRRDVCGAQQYSKDQVDTVCGTNCLAATPTVWRRREVLKDDECGGFLPPRPPEFYARYCTTVSKEYMSHWTDQDPLSCGFPPRTLHEWWVECGCSVRRLTSACLDFGVAPDLARARELGGSSDPKERAVGRLLTKMTGWNQRGNLESPSFDAVMVPSLKGLPDDDFAHRLGEFTGVLRLYMALRLQSDPAYRLKANTVRELSRRTGLEGGDGPQR